MALAMRVAWCAGLGLMYDGCRKECKEHYVGEACSLPAGSKAGVFVYACDERCDQLWSCGVTDDDEAHWGLTDWPCHCLGEDSGVDSGDDDCYLKE